MTGKYLLVSATALCTEISHVATLSSSSEDSTYNVERVPTTPNRCSEEAGVMAPAVAMNLLSTKFKMKCFVKGEIFLTPGIVHSWDQKLYKAPSAVESVQQ